MPFHSKKEFVAQDPATDRTNGSSNESPLKTGIIAVTTAFDFGAQKTAEEKSTSGADGGTEYFTPDGPPSRRGTRL
jgi:hypothetical protein